MVTVIALVSAAAVAPATAQRAAAVPAPVLTGAGVGSLTPSLERLQPAGDLQGNGKQDVLDIRRNSPGSATQMVGVTARNGATGKAIWTHRVAVQPYYNPTFVTARLGAGAALGVLIINPGWRPDGVGTDTLLALTALSGQTGHVIWTKTLSGFSANNTGTGTDIPSFDGVLTGGSARTASVLVSLATAGVDDTVDAELISGVNGHTSSFGPSENTDGSATFTVIPDTNHDGRSDVLLEAPGAGGFVRALSGTNGATIWTATGLPADSSLTPQPIGRFSSASEPDLAFGYYDGAANQETIYVLSGKTGAVVWNRPADGIYLIGKAGKHLQPALGLYSGLNTITSTSFTRAETYEAVSTTNHVIYQHTVTSHVTLPAPPVTSSEYEGGVFGIGDVQPDGAGETGLYAITSAADKGTSRADTRIGVIDGRTGVFHALAAQVGSDGSLHKGAGADLLAVGFHGHKPVLTAWDGGSRHRLYRRVLPVGSWLGEDVGGLRVSGHSCSDIALTTETANRGGLAVISGSGRPLWMVTFAHSAVSGGTVRHYPKPKHYCA
jgi:hypothetical protein